MIYPDDFLNSAHGFCTSNREALMQSSVCACFYCLEKYNPSTIIEWIDNKCPDTAICPLCGIDSVLAEKSPLPINDLDFLKQMQARYFSYLVPTPI